MTTGITLCISRLMVFPAILLTMAGCVTASNNYSFEGIKPAKDILAYSEHPFLWRDGARTELYIRLENLDNFLGLCGFFVMFGDVRGAMDANWVSQSQVYLGNKLISGGDFILEQTPADNFKYNEACVKTKVPFSASYSNPQFKIKGPRIKVRL
ncbi:MAG: hypothetical protein QF393_03295 [Rhodospirillales bacterium]|nr:hypothetical protein [Rhodospirillales bacterium]